MHPHKINEQSFKNFGYNVLRTKVWQNLRTVEVIPCRFPAKAPMFCTVFVWQVCFTQPRLTNLDRIRNQMGKKKKKGQQNKVVSLSQRWGSGLSTVTVCM